MTETPKTEGGARHPREDKDLVILLDLMYTLVANSKSIQASYPERIRMERYRRWLVDLIRGHTVLLLTVRELKWRQLTLSHIADQLDGWQPDAHWFNPTTNFKGRVVKAEYLRRDIFRQFGEPEETRYYAIESGSHARRMYASFRIPADHPGIYGERDADWLELPYYTHRDRIEQWRAQGRDEDATSEPGGLWE